MVGRPPLDQDLLNGLPEDYEAVLAVSYAQQILSDAEKSAGDILRIEAELFCIFDEWKLAHGKSVDPNHPLFKGISFENAQPWMCYDLLVDDPFDLFDVLLSSKYKPLLSLVEKYSEIELISILILHVALRGLGAFPQSPHRAGAPNIFENCMAGILSSYVFSMGGRLSTEESEIRKEKKLRAEVEVEIKSELGRLGAIKRSENHTLLVDYAVRIFNEGEYESIAKGATEILDQVQVYSNRQILTKNEKNIKSRNIADWLRKANKEEKLYKIFSR